MKETFNDSAGPQHRKLILKFYSMKSIQFGGIQSKPVYTIHFLPIPILQFNLLNNSGRAANSSDLTTILILQSTTQQKKAR